LEKNVTSGLLVSSDDHGATDTLENKKLLSPTDELAPVMYTPVIILGSDDMEAASESEMIQKSVAFDTFTERSLTTAFSATTTRDRFPTDMLGERCNTTEINVTVDDVYTTRLFVRATRDVPKVGSAPALLGITVTVDADMVRFHLQVGWTEKMYVVKAGTRK
jgi:hypothetical protein